MRGLIAELVSAKHQVTVTDMEAGLEHMSRSGGTLRHIDELLIVTEADRKAIETARRAITLATQLGIPRLAVIGNKLHDDAEAREIEILCNEARIELIAKIPYDELAHQADRRGVALYDFARDAETIKKLEEVANQLEQHFELMPERPLVAEHSPALTRAQRPKRFPDCD